jgi:hypothetical protein
MNKQEFDKVVQLQKIKNRVNRLYIENILDCIDNNSNFALSQKIGDRALKIVNNANITNEEILSKITNSVKDTPNLKGLKSQSSIKEDIAYRKMLVEDGWMSPGQDFDDYMDDLPD